MTKDILRKIVTGGILCTTDVTAEKKKDLYALMNKYGMSASTAYLRFFVKGFKQWEIQGVSELRDEFIKTFVFGNSDKDKYCIDHDDVLSIDPTYNDNRFYTLISSLKIGKDFCDFMAARGMSSQMTVRTRFKTNNWKPWEIKGIQHIIEDFFSCSEASENQADQIQYAEINRRTDKNDKELTQIERTLITISKTLKELKPSKTKNGITVDVPMQDYMQLLLLKMRTQRTLKDLAIQAIHEYVERNKIDQ